MKTIVSKSNVIMASALVVSIILAGAFYSGKINTRKQLEKEKIKSENLLSEKLKLDQSLISFKKELTAFKGKSANQDKLIAETRKKLERKEVVISKMTAANMTVKDLQKRVNELEMLKKELHTEVAKLQETLQASQLENNELNGLLTNLQNEKEYLEVNYTILKAIMADNYRIEALKGKNDKPTLNARRTNKLAVSFDIPANIREDLYFIVVTPSGEKFASKTDGNTTIHRTELPVELVASNNNNITGEVGMQRAEMLFEPDEKLQKGVYRFNVYNNENYLGSTQLKLK